MSDASELEKLYKAYEAAYWASSDAYAVLIETERDPASTHKQDQEAADAYYAAADRACDLYDKWVTAQEES